MAELSSVDESLFEILELLEAVRALRDMGRYDDACATCDLIVDDFGGDDDPEIAEAVAEALLFKGQTLSEMELFEEELDAYYEIYKLYGSNDSPRVVAQVGRACFNTAVAVSQVATADESIATYDLFIGRYKSNENPEIQEQVARAYLNVALIMRHSSRLEDALSAFENLIERYGASKDSRIQGVVVSTLASKAGLELELRKTDSAIESTSRALAIGDPGHPSSRYHCHLIRAAASFIKRDTASCLEDVESALRFLPDIELPMQAMHTVQILRTLASVLGKDRILDLVKRSQSATMLSPFAETLEADIVREAEQMRQIEDVARDLQRDFAHLDRSDG